MAKTNLSILLIKKEFSDFKEIIKNDTKSEVIGDGSFYWKRGELNTPKWVKSFFKEELMCKKDLAYKLASGVFLTKIRVDEKEERIFAICFGNGRSMLKPDTIQERFGLLVTLNSVEENSLRSIDINTIDSVPISNKIQSSKLTEITTLGIDIEKDLVKAAAGKCNDDSFTLNVAGSNPLKISTECDLHNIESVLIQAYGYFKSDDYKKNFPWIDFIKHVKEPGLIKNLNDKLIDNIRLKDFSNIWMGVPDVLEWERFSDFEVDRVIESCNDLDFEEIVNNIKIRKKRNPETKKLEDQPLSIRKLKNIEVVANSADEGYPLGRWKLYNCIYTEISIGKNLYLLNGGQWYEVETDFVKQIDDYYSKEISKSTLKFPDYNPTSVKPNAKGKIIYTEATYNDELRNSIPNSILLDAKFVYHGGGQSKFEICDVMTQHRQLIHVKKYSSSSVLSHLFNQGLNSGELLKTDKEFRCKANKIIQNQTSDITFLIDEDNFDSGNYEIIYAVITSQKTDLPKIPFFSKISIKHAHTLLKNFGYKVSIANITDTSV